MTEDRSLMRCAVLVETLMNAYEQMWASPGGDANSDEPVEAETPPTSDSSGWEKPGSSSRPPVSASTPTPLSATTTSISTTVADENFMGLDAQLSLWFDGLMNFDQMGGIEQAVL